MARPPDSQRRTQNAMAYRKAQMKTLRKMKEELEKAEKAQAKAAQIQRELLEAHTEATMNMHRSMMGKGPRKKKK